MPRHIDKVEKDGRGGGRGSLAVKTWALGAGSSRAGELGNWGTGELRSWEAGGQGQAAGQGQGHELTGDRM